MHHWTTNGRPWLNVAGVVKYCFSKNACRKIVPWNLFDLGKLCHELLIHVMNFRRLCCLLSSFPTVCWSEMSDLFKLLRPDFYGEIHGGWVKPPIRHRHKNHQFFKPKAQLLWVEDKWWIMKCLEILKPQFAMFTKVLLRRLSLKTTLKLCISTGNSLNGTACW